MTHQSARRGFTLIEVLVALGLFSVVILITNSIFTRFILNQRRDISEVELQEDMRFAIELFSREARTAYSSSFALLPGNATTGPTFIFRNQNGLCVAHRQQEQFWQRAEQASRQECDQVAFPFFAPVTSRNTSLEKLDFKIPVDIIDGGELARQGFVTIMLQAKSRVTSTPPIELQTTLTSRQVKIYGER